MTGEASFDWAGARARLAALGAALTGQASDDGALERIFAARAAALARRGAVAAKDPSRRHVIVRAGGEACAVQIADTAGVVRIGALARLPGGPDELAGALSEQGRIWPVLDLARLLGLAPAEGGPRCAVLLRRGVRRCALGVDALDGLRDVANTGPAGGASRFARAVADKLILVDADAVLDHPVLRKEGTT